MKTIRLLLLSTLLLIIFISRANAQRDAVDRKKGLKIHPCVGVSCSEENEDYSGEDLFCLKCLLYTADSTMTSEYNKLLNRVIKQKTKTAIHKSQKKWGTDTDKKAVKQSNEYRGGAMEATEFIRMKLVLTQKRILYLRSYNVDQS